MLWFYLMLSASFLWALGNLIGKYTLFELDKEGAIAIGFVSYVIPLFLLLLVAPISLSPVALLAGLFWLGGYYFYFQGLFETEVSKAIILLLTIPIFTAILSRFLLHEILLPLQYLGIGVAVAGSFLLSFDGFSLRRGAFYMLLASFLFALSDISLKATLSGLDVPSTLFWTQVLAVPAGLFFLWRWRSHAMPSRKILLFSFLATAFSFIAYFLALPAISITAVSLTTAIETTQPVFVLILATVISWLNPRLLQEDTTRRSLLSKAAALILLALGVFLVVR